MKPKLSRFEVVALAVLGCVAALFLEIGWRTFWFLTDDAFISYRYISNAHLGYGYVWNPPPFQPVEGYTNFLWIALLDVTWRLTGVAPPDSANVISLGLSAGTLIVASALTLQIPWTHTLRRYRVGFVALVLLCTLGNRSFLAWTSSGLETALVNLLVLAWLYWVLSRTPTATWVLVTATISSLLALTRPDGLLFVAATLGAIALARTKPTNALRLPWTTLPMLAVPAHLLWRKGFYGSWLPNTYYAKTPAAWPESGIRYASSFILEYALWFWAALGAYVLLRCAVRGGDTLRQIAASKTSQGTASGGSRVPISSNRAAMIPLLGVLTVVAHIAYYTLIVGGDHFEYRIYSAYIPLIFVSFTWLLNIAQFSLRAGLALFLCFGALTFPIPWTHWALSQGRDTRQETQTLFIPVAPHFPDSVGAYLREFDALQAWLIDHLVCTRHQEHKIAHQWWADHVIPTREVGKTLQPNLADLPILALRGGVGTTAWALPFINIIDLHGLNDRVIGRTPTDPAQTRRMAHSRRPPPGYVEAFAPNVRLGPLKRVVIERREEAMTNERIQAIEKHWQMP